MVSGKISGVSTFSGEKSTDTTDPWRPGCRPRDCGFHAITPTWASLNSGAKLAIGSVKAGSGFSVQ